MIPPPGPRPELLDGAAAELERLAARLDDAGRELARLIGSGDLGAEVDEHCRSVARALDSTLADAEGLASDLRRTAQRGESILIELARAALRAGTEPPPWAVRRPFDREGRPAVAPDGPWCPAGTGCPDDPVEPGAWSEWSEPAPRPGNGPLLGGTGGGRPDTSLGVRVAQLPDGP